MEDFKEDLKKVVTYDLVIGSAIVGSTIGATIALTSQPGQALTVQQVSTTMTSIVTNVDATADIAFPIGAALLAFGAIGGIIMRFIGG